MSRRTWCGAPVIWVLVAATVVAGNLFGTGCMAPPTEPVDTYLVKVGGSTLTVAEFNEVFEISKTAYSHSDTMNPAVVADIKLRLLNQLIEEMLLMESASALGIVVSDREFEREVQKIKADYPEGVFEEMLLEAAVPFEAWKKRLRVQLVARKFIQAELEAKVTITAEEVARYYAKHFPDDAPPEMDETKAGTQTDARSAGVSDAMILKMLKNQKVQAAYAEWMKTNRRSAVIDINSKQWEAISQAAS